MARKYLNNYTTLLTAAITDTDTTMTVGTAPAALTGGDYYRLQLSLRNAQGVLTKQEFVDVTAISGNDLTITRATEGSTALEWSAGARVELVETAASWDGLATDAQVATAISDHVAESDPHPQYALESNVLTDQRLADGWATANTGAIDVSLGNVFTVTPAAPITISLSGQISGQTTRIEVHLVGGDVNDITWPDDAQNSYVPTAYDIVRLTNPNGGADWYLEYVGSAA